jgi:hypothetical protein
MMIPNSFYVLCVIGALLIAVSAVLAFGLAWWWLPLIALAILVAIPAATLVLFWFIWAASGFR